MAKKKELEVVKRWHWIKGNPRDFLDNKEGLYEWLSQFIVWKRALNERTIQTLNNLDLDVMLILEDAKGQKYFRMYKFLKWVETHPINDVSEDFLKEHFEYEQCS